MRQSEASALPLTVNIISWNRNFQKIVVYLIQVQFNSRSWIVEKRYSEFRILYSEYLTYSEFLPISFPPKRLFHTEEVLNRRLNDLNVFLHNLIVLEFPEMNHFLHLVEHTSIPLECRHQSVRYLDKKLGSGLPASHGDIIRVHYIGRLQSSGEIFDRSRKKDGPFEFKLGAKEVVKGWDIGIIGMRMGGSRILTIPPEKAYGKRGMPPEIPPHSVLVFEIHLVEILRESMTRYSLPSS